MKGKIRFIGLIMVLALAAAMLVISGSGWAQKGKPIPPPVTPPDPAIAYSIWQSSPDHKDLMVVNADGTNKLALVAQRGVHNTRPDWSPDGKQLVFTDNALGGTAINIINRDGTGQKRILMFNSSWGPVSWSPKPLGDGKYKILYSDRAVVDGVLREDNDLFLVNLDGTGVQQITDTPGVNESVFDNHYIAWSPTAERFAVATCDDVLIYEINYDQVSGKFSAISHGGIIRRPDSPLQDSDCILDIDWANTQDKLVISAHPTWTASYDLFIVDVDYPTNVTQLTNTPLNYERECSWSPDDSQIAYIQGPSSGIWVIKRADGSAKEIVKPEKRAQLKRPHWRRNLQ